MRRILPLALAAAALWLTAACDDIFSDDQYDFSGIVLGSASQGDAGSAADLRRIETASMGQNTVFVAHSVPVDTDDGEVDVMTYCLAYDTVRMHSRWVAFRFDAVTRQQHVSRSNEPFMDDPSLRAVHYIGSGGFGDTYYDLLGQAHSAASLQPSYANAQFDRGHLCASADRLQSTEANAQTFYMTNMSPQLGAFNQRYWTAYESFVQQRGRSATFADTLYVVKGGTIADGQTLGYVPRYNGKEVAVPAYYYMALLYCKNNTYGAVAFLLEHKDYGVRNSGEVSRSEMASHAITVDDLEAFTGIDFFPNLPDAIEDAVESAVDLAVWGLN